MATFDPDEPKCSTSEDAGSTQRYGFFSSYEDPPSQQQHQQQQHYHRHLHPSQQQDRHDIPAMHHHHHHNDYNSHQGSSVGSDGGEPDANPSRLGISVQDLKQMTAMRMAQQQDGSGGDGGSGGALLSSSALRLEGERGQDQNWHKPKESSVVSPPLVQNQEEKDQAAVNNFPIGRGDIADSTPTLDAECEATEVDEDNLKTSTEKEMLSRGLDNEPTLPRGSTLVAQDAILTKSLGPSPAIYVSKAHAVEFELQAGSLDAELPLEMTITRRLAFVECRTEGSGRAPFCDDASTEEFLAMTFVHGPEGVSFPADEPAKLRFFLGYVGTVAPDEEAGSDQVVVADEEIERDILEAYRPLSSPDGVENWTTLGPYSVVFRRLHGQREVWVETPVFHFSTTANAMKVSQEGKNQSYIYEDLGTLRWWFKGRSAPSVRFGNATKNHCAIFTYYPIVEHTEASTESEKHAEIGAVEVTLGGGKRIQSSAAGRPLPAAGEIISLPVRNGTYEDCDLAYDVKEHSQMHVRVAVLEELAGEGAEATGKLQLLDVRKISRNKILVLREPRLKLPIKFRKIGWPCEDEDICRL